MPEISMCPSEDCPARRECYRNEASGTRPNPWRQQWADWTWRHPGGVSPESVACDGLWLLDREGSAIQRATQAGGGAGAP